MLLFLAITVLPVSFALVLDILIFSDYFANPAYLPVPGCKEIEICVGLFWSSAIVFCILYIRFQFHGAISRPVLYNYYFSPLPSCSIFCFCMFYCPLLNFHPFSLRIQALFNLCELLSTCFYYLPTTSFFSPPTAMLTVSKILVWMCVWPFDFLFPSYLLL